MKDFEEVESLETEIAEIRSGRRKLAEVSDYQRQRLNDYLRQKRAHQRRQLAALDAEVERRLSARQPKVAVLRHVRLTPGQFPEGTRVRQAYELMNELREPFQETCAAFADLCAKRALAQKAVDDYDPETATSPNQYRGALAELEFYQAKLRVIGPKARRARERFDLAQQTLRSGYSQYSRYVNELNAIRDLERPFGLSERVTDRAKEVARVAELEYLINALLTPPAQVAQRSAA